MQTDIENLSSSGKQQALLRLLQLNSPALPVGSYAYSQGLECVVEADWVNDAESLQQWLKGLMEGAICHVDIPLMQRLFHAFVNKDIEKIKYWNFMLLAYRETSELRKEELDKGHAAVGLLKELNIGQTETLLFSEKATFLMGYSCAAVSWKIELEDAAQGYVWAWLENQLVSAMKIMSLGQVASQKILNHLIETIPVIVNEGLNISDDDIGTLLPAQVIACAKHETQYSRLFRS